MSAVHGKGMVLKVATNDISTYCTSSKLTRKGDSNEITGYGKNSHVYAGGGLKGGTFTCEGWYDNTTTTGTHDVFTGMEGTIMAIIRQPEGTGSGKQQQSFDGLLDTYDETAPVNDIIRWSASFTVSDDIDDTDQT